MQYILVLHVNLRNYLLVDEVEGADSSTSSSDIGQVNLIVLFILNDSSLSQQLYRRLEVVELPSPEDLRDVLEEDPASFEPRSSAPST